MTSVARAAEMFAARMRASDLTPLQAGYLAISNALLESATHVRHVREFTSQQVDEYASQLLDISIDTLRHSNTDGRRCAVFVVVDDCCGGCGQVHHVASHRDAATGWIAANQAKIAHTLRVEEFELDGSG